MPFKLYAESTFMLLSSRRTLDTRGTYLRIARGGVDATHSATLRARRSPRVQSLSDCCVEVEPKGFGFQWKALAPRCRLLRTALDEAGNVGVAALKIGVLVILVFLRVRVACRQPRARIGWRRRKQLVKLGGWETS